VFKQRQITWERTVANYTLGHDSCDLVLRKKYHLCDLPFSKKYRSHFEIIASILDAAKFNDGDRYFLMKRTSVNYAQLKKYLDTLTKIGFIEVRMRDQQILYCATNKGLEFLNQYYVLIGMLVSTYELSRQGQLIYQAAQAAFKKSQTPRGDSLPQHAS
jgi:predicted transcriptional regulator